MAFLFRSPHVRKGLGTVLGAGLTSPLWMPSVSSPESESLVQPGPSTPLTHNVIDPIFHILGVPTMRTHALTHQVRDSITGDDGEFDGRSLHVAGHSEGGMNSVLATDPTLLGEDILRKRGDSDLRLRDIMRIVDEFGDGGPLEDVVSEKIDEMALEDRVRVSTLGSPHILGQGARENVTAYSAENDPITWAQRMLGFPYEYDNERIHEGGHGYDKSYSDKAQALLSDGDPGIFSGGMFTAHAETEKRVSLLNES